MINTVKYTEVFNATDCDYKDVLRKLYSVFIAITVMSD